MRNVSLICLVFQISKQRFIILDFSVCYSLVAITASLYTLAALLQVQCVDCLRNSTISALMTLKMAANT